MSCLFCQGNKCVVCEVFRKLEVSHSVVLPVCVIADSFTQIIENTILVVKTCCDNSLQVGRSTAFAWRNCIHSRFGLVEVAFQQLCQCKVHCGLVARQLT